MTSTGPSSTLEDAWGLIPHSREATAGIGTFTRQRVERIISISSGVGSLILAAQALLTALGQRALLDGAQDVLLAVVFGSLTIMVVACLVGRAVRLAAGVFAVVYLTCLLAWPVVTVGENLPDGEAPWIWYLVNIATLAAVLAFPVALQIVWTIAVPLIFGFVRLLQGGFTPEAWFAVGLDVSFALILGGVILSLGWVLRSIAVGVDGARAKAVDSYAAAAAADAAEQERVAVAALMHDSVLAALIAAERAVSPRARTLAVAMAREALTRLANAEQDGREGSDEAQHPHSLADQVEVAARELGVTLQVDRHVADDAPSVPGRVARALVLATTQAIANAVQHADGVGLSVALGGSSDRIRVVVRDSGEGFDMEAVPDDRLGIRGSIIARVAAAGGTVKLDSSAAGTIIVLLWPAPPSAVDDARPSPDMADPGEGDR